MSYCRFSSDNWMSDVYVYADVAGGWTTHVASRRRRIPPVPPFPLHRIPISLLGARLERKEGAGSKLVYSSRVREMVGKAVFGMAALWHSRVHMASLKRIPLRPIGKPQDGQTFSDPSPEDCANRLEGLRAMGYRVPQYAIDALREEAREARQENGQGEGGESTEGVSA